jgi:hypothetical protein
VPADPPFSSFGRNAEDVVLHRALGDATTGRYVDVHPGHPTDASVTRAFYDRGWSGVVVDPVTGSAAAFRRERARDTVVEALDGHLDEGAEIQFMVVGTDGAEPALAGVDLGRWRPWVLVVAGAGPGPVPPHWDQGVLDAGYEFCLFDGASRFYVAAERAEALRVALSYPANADDDFVPSRCHELGQELAALRSAHDDALEELVRWRGAVLARWSDAVGTSLGAGGSAGRGSHEVVRLREELAAMQATVSWRVTAPLRALQQRRLRAWR